MLSFLKAFSEYEVILENISSEWKGSYLKQKTHLHRNLARHVQTQWNPTTHWTSIPPLVFPKMCFLEKEREKERGRKRERKKERKRVKETLVFVTFNFVKSHVFTDKLTFLEIPKIHWNSSSCSKDMKIFSFKCIYFHEFFWFFDLLYFLLTDTNI